MKCHIAWHRYILASADWRMAKVSLSFSVAMQNRVKRKERSQPRSPIRDIYFYHGTAALNKRNLFVSAAHIKTAKVINTVANRFLECRNFEHARLIWHCHGTTTWPIELMHSSEWNCGLCTARNSISRLHEQPRLPYCHYRHFGFSCSLDTPFSNYTEGRLRL